MDVDDLAGHEAAKRRRDDLHVASQDYQIDVAGFAEVDYLLLLVGLGLGCYRKVVEGDTVRFCKGLEIRVVRNDERYFDTKLPSRLPEEQVVEAVPNLGNHKHYARLYRKRLERKVHRHIIGGLPECLLHLAEIRIAASGAIGISLGWAKVHSHEETLRRRVTKLLRVQDVLSVLREKTGHRVDNARSIRAGEGQDAFILLCLGHVGSRSGGKWT